MRVLVVGGDRVDAGKTTFSTALLERIGGVGFKPRAGNDYWFDHDDVRRAVADGRLYGKDAKRLAAASAAPVAPEEINPVHRLWRPSPGPGTGLVGRARRRFVLDRVRPSSAEGDRTDGARADEFVVNAAADVPDPVAAGLPVGDAAAVDSVEALDAVTRERYLPSFERLADRVRDRDRAVVESYADVARPLTGVPFDAVAAVEPARVRVYDGDRYLTACDVAGGSAREGSLEETVPDVVDHLSPAATVSLPALPDAERSDPAAAADAYEVALDAVIAAALE
ncbi:ATPase [Halostella sp. JP-L12]|uniref:ATPase n=1 Tax=Halostella TaxID=1843185 RepID=UPI000EF77A7C|nr:MULTISPECIES: ATPase [Halostella]NHN48500.1 ATPase [Halostella sp. JP-L12]